MKQAAITTLAILWAIIAVAAIRSDGPSSMQALADGTPAAAATDTTSSIGPMVQAWQIDHPAHTQMGYYPSFDFYFLAAPASGPCGVEIQYVDLVTDPKHRCFDSKLWGAGEWKGNPWMVVPVPRSPEYVVRVGDDPRWYRVSRTTRGWREIQMLRIGGKTATPKRRGSRS